MQRKVVKQLGKVTQWTNEKVFSGEKTQFSSDFSAFEKDIDIKKNGIERLHATSEPFFNQIVKRKPTSDPHPPPGTGKDKILITEALGLVMIDYGDAVVGGFGDGLAKYGRARCKMALVQEEFGNRLSDGYIGNLTIALDAVNEYKGLRKKLDSRRLTLDAAISKLNNNKKGDPGMLEEDIALARMRFQEVEEETMSRGEIIANLEHDQYVGLTDLLEAELEYYTQCKDILEEVKASWPAGPDAPIATRPRAKSNASSRSFARGNSRGYSRQSAPASDDDDDDTANRARSHSNASSGGKTDRRRSILPSFGSFGRKSGLGATNSRSRKGSKADKYDSRSGSRMALHSEDDEEDDEYRGSPSASGFSNGRNRSHSTISASRMSASSPINAGATSIKPSMRRMNTAPVHSSARYVKALYDFPGRDADELPLRTGQVVEVKQEVNTEWWIGECEGREGLFPSTYCEEYIPSPTTVLPRRTIPPPSGGTSTPRAVPPQTARTTSNTYELPPSPTIGFHESESEFDSHGFSDAEHYATAAFASAPQPPPISRGGTPSLPVPSPVGTGTRKKPPPPPPPSRRSQSSSNILATASFSPLGPSSSHQLPQRGVRPRANTAIPPSSSLQSAPVYGSSTNRTSAAAATASPFGGGSPFGGSDDELPDHYEDEYEYRHEDEYHDEDEEDEDGGDQEYLTTTPRRVGGVGNGLGGMHR